MRKCRASARARATEQPAPTVERRLKSSHSRDLHVASVSRRITIGDTARGLEALEEAMRGDGDLTLAQAIGSPRYDKIRGSPRFAALLRRLNLNVERLTAPDGGRSR